MKQQLKFYWHIHHNILLEPLTDSLENRIKFIKETKPKDEIKLRLKLLKPVKGKLPKEFVDVGKKYNEARKKYNEVWKKYDEAQKKYDEVWKKYKEVWKKYKPQIEALHKKECPDCPWDGETIFPNKY